MKQLNKGSLPKQLALLSAESRHCHIKAYRPFSTQDLQPEFTMSKDIIAAFFFVAVTAAFGEIASLLVQSELYDGPTTITWSNMPPSRKFVTIGFPCIGAAFGAALILCGSLNKKRPTAVAPAATPVPAHETGIGKNEDRLLCEVVLIER